MLREWESVSIAQNHGIFPVLVSFNSTELVILGGKSTTAMLNSLSTFDTRTKISLELEPQNNSGNLMNCYEQPVVVSGQQAFILSCGDHYSYDLIEISREEDTHKVTHKPVGQLHKAENKAKVAQKYDANQAL